MRQGHVDLSKLLINTGHGVPINENFQNFRESLGLSRNPPTTHSFPDAVKDIQTLIISLGFDKLVGWESPDQISKQKIAHERPAKRKHAAKVAKRAKSRRSGEDSGVESK